MSLFAVPPVGISSPNPMLLPVVTLVMSTCGQAGRGLDYLCKMLSLHGFACHLVTRVCTVCAAVCAAVLKLIPKLVSLNSS